MINNDPISQPSALAMAQARFNQRIQILLDRSAPHWVGRWIGLAVVVLLYLLRVWSVRGERAAVSCGLHEAATLAASRAAARAVGRRLG